MKFNEIQTVDGLCYVDNSRVLAAGVDVDENLRLIIRLLLDNSSFVMVMADRGNINTTTVDATNKICTDLRPKDGCIDIEDDSVVGYFKKATLSHVDIKAETASYVLANSHGTEITLKRNHGNIEAAKDFVADTLKKFDTPPPNKPIHRKGGGGKVSGY